MHPATMVASVFQLTLLDLHSFLFTTGIIWIACRSRNLFLFLIELITDISILSLFFVLIFSLLYFWHLTNLFAGLFASFFFSLLVGFFIWASHDAFRYLGHHKPSIVKFQDPFLPLAGILFLSAVISSILGVAFIIIPSLRVVILVSSFYKLIFVLFIPIIIFWSLRILKMRPEYETDHFTKVLGIMLFLFYLSGGIFLLTLNYPLLGKFYEFLPSSQNSRFVFVLVLSSALPSLAHLLAMAAAILAKATPKRLQQFINRHLDAMSKNDDKVLSQLGNGCGVLGALITAIIQLI